MATAVPGQYRWLLALPDAACQELLWKPLDTAIGWLFVLYCPGGHQGNRQTNDNQQIHLQIWPLRGHGNAPVRNCMHCPMEEVQGFTRSHWTPPLGNDCGRYHKRYMAMPVFLMFFIVKTIDISCELMLRPLFSIGAWPIKQKWRA